MSLVRRALVTLGWGLALGLGVALPAPSQAAPPRIVSLVPSATETLCALGACEQLVGTDDFSNHPASVQALPKLGGLDDVALERLLALKPDVVVAAPSARVVPRLRSLGIKVLPLATDTHADLQHAMLVLAQAAGQGDGAALWQRLQQGLAGAAARVPAGWRGAKVLFEVDEGPWVAGAGSYIGQTLAQLGLGNVAGPELGPFPQLNPEYLLRSNPALLVLRRNALPQWQRRGNMQHLGAWKAGRVCALSEVQNDTLVRPGPRLVEGAEAIVACLERLSPP